MVSAPFGDDGGGDAGEAYVIFGKASGFGTADGTGRQVIDLTTLSAINGFIIQGDSGSDQAGYSVSSAGDVNGDGFADLFAGARYGDDGGSDSGKAYVIFGKASGFGNTVGGRQVLDLTTLSSADGFVIQGDTFGDTAGASVSSGDVNGDGFSDLIIGAPHGDDGGTWAGETYVVFGKASGFGANVGGRQVIDLTTLSAADGFIIQGDTGSDQSGWTIAVAGDVNNDGFADVLVSAHQGTDGGPLAGEAYLVFGKATGFGSNVGGRQVLDLTTLSAADGFIIQGDTSGDNAGLGLSSAGDLNGDGYADLIVGAPFGDDGGTNAGEAYVVFGKAAGFGTNVGGRQVIDLTTLSTSDGFILQGGTGDNLGRALSSAGDINGDGFDDLIIGNRYGDDGGSNAGEAYILFGKASGFGYAVGGRQVIDLTSFSAADGIIIQGDTASDTAGFSVSSAGDVNADGFADMIVGARLGDDGGTDTGEAYVLFGSAFGGSTTPVITTGTGASEIFIGGLGNDILTGNGGADVFRGGAGNDLLSIGDLTFRSIDGGSGTDTLASSGAGLSLDLTNRTLAAKISGIERIDLTGSGNNSLTLDQLAVFNDTPASGDGHHVLTVAGNAGDTVNFTEAQWMNVGTVTEGSVTYDRYEFGKAEVRVQQGVSVTFPGVFDLTFLKPTQGFIIQGDAVGDQAGRSVSAAGDVNGDGFADVIIGASQGDDGGTDAGEAYVIFGSASGFGTSDGGGRQVIDLTTLSASQGFIVQGNVPVDTAGWSVASAGDLNGDGFDELLVGAQGGDAHGYQSGEAYVVFGSGSGFGSTVAGRQVIDITNLTSAQGFIVHGAAAGNTAGWSVNSAGDINSDGFGDMIVGACQNSDGGYRAGAAYVIYGSASGFGGPDGSGHQVVDLGTLPASQGFVIQGDAGRDPGDPNFGDLAGWSVASGDFNGDGFADVIVGAVFGDDGGHYAGEAYVVFGSATGPGSPVGVRQVLDLSYITASEGFIIQGDSAGDNAGFSVASAGDINGDGFDDMIVGAPRDQDGGIQAGEAYVVFGKSSGFGIDVGGRQVIDLTTLSATDGFVLKGPALTYSGYSVSSAGDVNGDGFDDIIVGASCGDLGGTDAGQAWIVFGKASTFGSNVGGRQIVDLNSFSNADGFIVRGDITGDNAGRSVSSAGDVNRDGFSDIIVGARLGDDGGADAGEAYVLFGGAFGASVTPVATTGSGAAEIFMGDVGNDTLTGDGGADVFRGGSGDDTIVVPDLGFRLADGGLGTDTLKLADSGQAFDFSTLPGTTIEGIEAIDFAGSGDNMLTLRAGDVLQFSDTPNADFTVASSHNSLVVLGDLGDQLNLVGFDPDGAGGNPPVSSWALQSSDVNLDGSASGLYDIYDLVQGGTTIASVAVQHDVTVDITQHSTLLV